MRLAKLAIIGLVASLLAPAAQAQPTCAGGNPVASARLSLPVPMRDVTSLIQYAWDGANGIVNVCDLTGGTSSLGYWDLYSGEVDARFGGICIGVTARNGQTLYSCAAPRSVRIAFGAPRTQRASEIRFNTWHASVRAQ